MSTYVLVHCGNAGAWDWYNIIPLLEKQGHTVVAPDLPGHGADRSIPLSDVTMRDYVNRISGVIRAQNEPVILVGHSMGGVAVSQTAEECSDRVQKLIYVAAWLVPNGQSLVDCSMAETNADSQSSTFMAFDEENKVINVFSDKAVDVLFHDAPARDVELAKLLVQPNPLQPVLTKLQLSEKYDRIPRFYIECLNDRSVSISHQRAMYNQLPCERVFSLSSGHAPTFSMPDELAAILLLLA